MTTTFDTRTAVIDDVSGPWRAPVDEGLSGFGAMHGGYLAALALRAMTKTVADPSREPRSLALHLLGRVEPGSVDKPVAEARAGLLVENRPAGPPLPLQLRRVLGS